jgi:hypothetical protein
MNQYNWTPDIWASFSLREKAIVIAGIQLRVEEEEKERKKAERDAERAKRRRR